MDLSWVDFSVMGGFFGLLVWMGYYFSRRNTSTEEYFLGGRSFPSWAIGISMVGTLISSITFLALPADAYKTTWLRFSIQFGMIPAVVIAVYLAIPFYRRTGMTTAYEYLEGRFGPGIRVYGAVTFILAQLVRVSLILFLVSVMIHEITGVAPTLCVLIGGGLIGLYTVVGGMAAVVWTDVIQTIVLVLGGVFCLAIIICELPGGLAQILTLASESGKFSFAEWNDGTMTPVSWGLTLREKTLLMLPLLGTVLLMTETCCGQNSVQRYCASRSTRDARKALWLCLLVSLPIWAFYMFLGTSLYVFFQQFPSEEAAEMLSGARKAEQILPFFVIHYLPPGLSGLVIAGAMAAAMSSLDSSINAISTVSIVDIYRRHLVTNRDDRHYLRVARAIATVAAALMIAGGVVLIHAQTKTLQDAAQILNSLVGGGLLSIFMVGFLTRVGDGRTVGIGIVCTMLFTGWTILAQYQVLPDWLDTPFDLYYTTIIGNLVMFVGVLLAGALLPSAKKDLTNLTVWDQDRVTGE
jgi:solute:Na+ symporter, SSS family